MLNVLTGKAEISGRVRKK